MKRPFLSQFQRQLIYCDTTLGQLLKASLELHKLIREIKKWIN